MFCKNRITLIGFLGKDAETRFTSNGTAHTRFYAEQRFMRSKIVQPVDASPQLNCSFA
jgi:single-stranded DNA-binding protein